MRMGGGAAQEHEQQVVKDSSLGITAPYETKLFHEMRGFRVCSLRSMVWVPKLRGEAQDLFDICNILFKEGPIRGGTGGGMDTMEGSMHKRLDEG